MDKTTLQAEVREGRGKGSARRLREQGKLPAVLYGPGLDPTPLTVSPKALLKALRSEYGRNAVYEVEFAGKKELAMVKDLETDPVSGDLLHADFYRVTEESPVTVQVPFQTKGRAQGVRMGGVLTVTTRAIPLKTKVNNIPKVVEVDVTPLEIGGTIAVKDLVLPAGCTAAMRAEHTLAIVLESRKSKADGAEPGAPAKA